MVFFTDGTLREFMTTQYTTLTLSWVATRCMRKEKSQGCLFKVVEGIDFICILLPITIYSLWVYSYIKNISSVNLCKNCKYGASHL
jgi:hypothetical protein